MQRQKYNIGERQNRQSKDIFVASEHKIARSLSIALLCHRLHIYRTFRTSSSAKSASELRGHSKMHPTSVSAGSSVFTVQNLTPAGTWFAQPIRE